MPSNGRDRRARRTSKGSSWWSRAAAWAGLRRRSAPLLTSPTDRPPRGRQYAFSEELDRVPLAGTAMELQALFSAYRDADDGNPEAMIDAFKNRVQVDAHLRGLLLHRRSIALKKWVIQEGGPDELDKLAASTLEKALRAVPGFTLVLAHQANFNGCGWALSEIDWQRIGDVTVPARIVNVPSRRTRFDRTTDLPRLVTSTMDIDGVPLIPGKWWYTHRTDGDLVTEAGLLRTAAIWSQFKSMSVRDWLVLADRFGLPYAIGKYDEDAPDKDKEVLEEAVSSLGTDGYAVMSAGCDIALQSAEVGKADGVHGALTAFCDLQISKLVAGATLLNEVSGQASYAIGKVHQTRGFALNLADAEWLANSFVESIGLPFIHYNGWKCRPPRLKLHLTLAESVLEQCKIASICANELGMAIDEQQLRDITLLRSPGEGEGLRGMKNGGGADEAEE